MHKNNLNSNKTLIKPFIISLSTVFLVSTAAVSWVVQASSYSRSEPLYYIAKHDALEISKTLILSDEDKLNYHKINELLIRKLNDNPDAIRFSRKNNYCTAKVQKDETEIVITASGDCKYPVITDIDWKQAGEDIKVQFITKKTRHFLTNFLKEKHQIAMFKNAQETHNSNLTKLKAFLSNKTE